MRPQLLFAGLVAFPLVLAGCGGGERDGGAAAPTVAPGDSASTIAYVDERGCIARVDSDTAKAVGAPFCTSSRSGVTSLTWIDEDRLAFTTAEGRALGWQLVDFRTNRVTVMEMTEAPRVFLIPPQLWSPLGERVDVDGFGRATVETDEGSVQVFPPESREPDSSTRLVAWSPDAGSMILSVTTKKALWVVDRDGSNARQIAAESRGTASWWMDNAGATPHADLTCSVITAGSYACLPGVRGPYDGGETYDFAWAPCPGATGYEIQVLDASGATVFETLIAGSFAHIEKAELPDGELTWRIRAIIGPTPAPWADAQPLVPGASFAAVP